MGRDATFLCIRTIVWADLEKWFYEEDDQTYIFASPYDHQSSVVSDDYEDTSLDFFSLLMLEVNNETTCMDMYNNYSFFSKLCYERRTQSITLYDDN